MTPAARLEALFSFQGVAAAALLYAAVNGALTLAAGPALALDDVKLNVLAQSLQGGYLPDNPPLFEWTLFVVQRVLGPALASFVAVKSLFLVATALFTYLAANEASGDKRAAAVAAFALPLIPQFGGVFHKTLTHSTALFAATAFFWWALLRLERRRRVFDYALLGAAIGVGILAKYSFLAAAAAALLAALMRAPLRAALLSPRIAVTLLAASAAAAPHLFWAASADIQSADVLRDRLSDEGSHFNRAAEGLGSVLWAAISFLAPAAIVALAAVRGQFRTLTGAARDVFSDAAMISIGGLAMTVAVFGLANFQERYAIPFLFSGFLWLTLAAFRHAGAAGTFIIASVALVIAFASARVVEIARPGAPFCDKCRQHIPYADLERAIADRGAEEATLVGFDDHTAGNLRRLFPRARVLSSHLPSYAPPPAAASSECYFFWSADLSPPPDETAIAQLDQAGIKQVVSAWSRVMAGEIEARTTTWSFAEVDQMSPIGKALCRL
jgi:hypothetical protein